MTVATVIATQYAGQVKHMNNRRTTVDTLRHPTGKKLISKTNGDWGAPGRATWAPRDPHHPAKL